MGGVGVGGTLPPVLCVVVSTGSPLHPSGSSLVSFAQTLCLLKRVTWYFVIFYCRHARGLLCCAFCFGVFTGPWGDVPVGLAKFP